MLFAASDGKPLFEASAVDLRAKANDKYQSAVFLCGNEKSRKRITFDCSIAQASYGPPSAFFPGFDIFSTAASKSLRDPNRGIKVSPQRSRNNRSVSFRQLLDREHGTSPAGIAPAWRVSISSFSFSAMPTSIIILNG